MIGSLKTLLARASDVRTREVTADGLMVLVREPSAAVHAYYVAQLREGRPNAGAAVLLRECVLDDTGTPCLTQAQAEQLAGASTELALPILHAILDLASSEKKPHAPGADDVPNQPASGAAAQ